MAASMGIDRVLNPFILHLKKMELELNCPICLKLMNQPMLLSCDHMLCRNCITAQKNDGFSCPVCGMPCLRKDLRPANHIERFSTIYKGMDSYISSIYEGSSFEISGSEIPFTGIPISCDNHSGKKHARDTEHETLFEQGQPSPPDNMKDSDSDSWDLEGLNKFTAQEVNMPLDEVPNFSTKHAKLNDHVATKSNRHFQDDFTGRDTKVDQDESTIVTCAFCHSFRITEVSGEMLHYLNGEQVSGDQTRQLSVRHVHKRCIEWAPRIYFSGETIKNLEKELSRSSKIKCHSCGLKGAALGCYVKSCRRSFHIPCAYEILECRWDCGNYLMLCPAHAAHKLPCDKAKIKKSNEFAASSDHQKFQTKEHVILTSLSSPRKDLVICGSDLSKEDKILLNEFARTNCLTITHQWEPNVTHVIAGTNEHGACMRTMKYLMAILCGRWVLNMDWIRTCLAAGRLVPEEKYEITCDIHGCVDGTKSGRTRAMQGAWKLFNGLAFHFTGFLIPAYRSNLEDLAVAGGGIVLTKRELLDSSVASPAARDAPKVFIVYCADAPKDDNPVNIEKAQAERLQDAEALGAKAAAAVVRHTLFLNAIAAHNLLLLL